MAKQTLTAEPGSHEIVMTRVFDAPPEKVYQAFTDPALIPQWWGMEGVTTIVDELDVRKGGKWRFIHRGEGGEEYAFNGVYLHLAPNEQVVYSFEFEPMPGHILMETVTLEAQPDGKTKVIDSSVFQSVADRDGMLASGMESGATESWDRLEALLGA